MTYTKGEAVRRAMLLYAVTDRSWLLGRSLAEQVKEALEGGITCIQLREKKLCGDDFWKEAEAIGELAGRYGVPFIINDDVEAALRCNAQGVHVGQSDMGAAEVRVKIGKDKILGVSVQTVEQALRAEEQGADYLGVGAVFATGTKPDADSVSGETLAAICRAVSIPVTAIGGIDENNVTALKGTGIDGIAVVSAIFSRPNIRAAARRLRELSEQTAAKGTSGRRFFENFMDDIRGAVFDMDGTLLDSMYVWDNLGEEFLRSRSIEPRGNILEVLRPMSLRQAAEYFIRDYGLTETAEEIMESVNRSIERFYRCEAQLKPGVKEVLERLKQSGIPMCVATATDRYLAEGALSRTGILPYFTEIFTCGQVGAGKDSPQIFLTAAQSLETEISRTFVFEDALFAARTVKQAGIPLAVVYDPSTEGQREDLKQIADVYIQDWRELL